MNKIVFLLWTTVWIGISLFARNKFMAKSDRFGNDDEFCDVPINLHSHFSPNKLPVACQQL